jgi:hypothetical protein
VQDKTLADPINKWITPGKIKHIAKVGLRMVVVTDETIFVLIKDSGSYVIKSQVDCQSG